MGYLDSAGLAHFWGKVRSALAGKQERLSGSFGQVVGFSGEGTPEAQYLTAGQVSDGNPVGTVISFLGLTAPVGYLVCDGAEHAVGEYPALADFFRQQFGSAHHFGGDGEVTFAVPDMRNLFLRGYHGGAAERRSGNVGERQAGTEIPDLYSGRSQNGNGYIGARVGEVLPDTSNVNLVKNPDWEIRETATVVAYVAGSTSGFSGGNSYETRPVNMAVLYCVKAV